MSFAVGDKSPQGSSWSRLLWTVFPHIFLILCLVGYAGMGAFIFQHLEGQAEAKSTPEEYQRFVTGLARLAASVSDSGNSSQSQAELLQVMDAHITRNFKSIWLQTPERWTFFGAMFFCCTVFTTVGYGEIYPVTLAGKSFCIVYAMVGIPLMLLVISDVGDMLAMLLSNSYQRLHRFLHWSVRRCQHKPVGQGVTRNGTYAFNHDVVIHPPLDISRALHPHMGPSTAAESCGRGTVKRSLSCPDLAQMASCDALVSHVTEIGEKLDKLDVPITLILVVVFAYILSFGCILTLWEKEIGSFDAIYFSFITLTTIGFGDIVPNHPKYFMLTSFFIISGMAIMSMAFKLGQSRIVFCYRKCINCISRGKVEQYRHTAE